MYKSFVMWLFISEHVQLLHRPTGPELHWAWGWAWLFNRVLTVGLWACLIWAISLIKVFFDHAQKNKSDTLIFFEKIKKMWRIGAGSCDLKLLTFPEKSQAHRPTVKTLLKLQAQKQAQLPFGPVGLYCFEHVHGLYLDTFILCKKCLKNCDVYLFSFWVKTFKIFLKVKISQGLGRFVRIPCSSTSVSPPSKRKFNF